MSAKGQKRTFVPQKVMSALPPKPDIRGCDWMSAKGQKRTFVPQKVMSALPPKADMCGATRHVRFGPIADMANHSITSSARASNDGGIVRSSAFAVLRLITSSYLVCSQ